MCTVNVKVNEAVLRDVLPELDSTAAISRWAQMLIDQHIDALTREYALRQDVMPEELNTGLEPDLIYADDDETVDLETARQMTLEVIREEYARP